MVEEERNWGPTLRMLSDFQLKTKQPGNTVHRDAVSFGATYVDLSYVLASCFLKFFLFILWEFPTIYFEHILSLVSVLPRFFLTSLTTQFHIYFLLKNSQNHSIQCLLPNSCWVWDLPWSVVDIPNVTPLKENSFSLSQMLSIANRVLVRSGILYPLPLLPTAFLFCKFLFLIIIYGYHTMLGENLFWGRLIPFCQRAIPAKRATLGQEP